MCTGSLASQMLTSHHEAGSLSQLLPLKGGYPEEVKEPKMAVEPKNMKKHGSEIRNNP